MDAFVQHTTEVTLINDASIQHATRLINEALDVDMIAEGAHAEIHVYACFGGNQKWYTVYFVTQSDETKQAIQKFLNDAIEREICASWHTRTEWIQ